jgi:cytochrome oxidase Cu insertion factor (SCO1/SenC/PrrC family)
LPHRALGFALTVCLVVLAGCRGATPPTPATRSPQFGAQAVHRQVPRAILNTPLLSASGEKVDLTSFPGKVLVISDIMTLCQETCPLDTANVVAAAQAVAAAGLSDRVEFLSITVDPNRDTPARLAAFQRLFAPVPANWITLTGTSTALAALWRYLGVYTERVPDDAPAPKDWLTGKPLTYDITHTDAVFFLDPAGTERYLLAGHPYVARGTGLPPTLRSFLSPSGVENLDNPGAGSWTVADMLSALGTTLNRVIPAAPSRGATR